MSGGSLIDSCLSSVKDDWGHLGNSRSHARRHEEDCERQLVANANSTCKQDNVTLTKTVRHEILLPCKTGGSLEKILYYSKRGAIVGHLRIFIKPHQKKNVIRNGTMPLECSLVTFRVRVAIHVMTKRKGHNYNYNLMVITHVWVQTSEFCSSMCLKAAEK